MKMCATADSFATHCNLTWGALDLIFKTKFSKTESSKVVSLILCLVSWGCLWARNTALSWKFLQTRIWSESTDWGQIHLKFHVSSQFSGSCLDHHTSHIFLTHSSHIPCKILLPWNLSSLVLDPLLLLLYLCNSSHFTQTQASIISKYVSNYTLLFMWPML